MSEKKTPTVCVGCALAVWDKTETGRLRPDGGGQCTWSVEVPLPASMPTWGIAARDIKQGVYTLRGGRIQRWDKFQIREQKCPVKQPVAKTEPAQ